MQNTDRQQISLHEETIDHEATGGEARLGGDASPHVIELQPARFSDKAIQHGRHPTHVGRMEHPDAHGSRVGWCGEVMEMYFRLDGDRIEEASFWADGCLSTMACGDMLTAMAQGMTLEEAMAITPEELIAALDGLPYKSRHCAELSVETLQEALAERSKEVRESVRHVHTQGIEVEPNMKLIITATAPDIEAVVDPRFGRGAYFIVVDADTMQWQAHENPGVNATGGAGSQAAQFAAQQGADAVISGDFGPNAYIALAAAEIKMYLHGSSRTAREAVANLAAGTLAQVHAPTGAGRHGGRGR